MASINSTTFTSWQSTIDRVDYIPFISSGKAILDLFLIYVWKPANPELLTPFAKAYYQHISTKDDFRWVAAIPILGNVILFSQGKIEKSIQNLIKKASEEALEKHMDTLYDQQNTANEWSTTINRLDYIPIVSTGKVVVDLCLTLFWNPLNLDLSSPFVRAYHRHLCIKYTFRWAAALPILGNATVFYLHR